MNVTKSVFQQRPGTTPTVPPAPAPAPAATAPLDQGKQYGDIASGSQVKAVAGTFDESKGVAGRVNDLTSANSPIMQAARTRAAQAAQARGLRNSSMAVQSGEQAVIETATPIAQTDAQLYQNQALKNQDALNSTNQFNANIRTNVGLAGAEATKSNSEYNRTLLEQARQFDTNASLDRDKLKEQGRQFDADQGYKQRELEMRQTLAQMDASSRESLARIEADNKAGIESNQNIANAWGTLMNNISQIQNNPELNAETKKTLIDNQIASFQSFTTFWQKATGGSIDVSDLLRFTSGTGPVGPDGKPVPAPAPAPAPSTDPTRPGWPYNISES